MADWITYVEETSADWQLQDYSAAWFGVLFGLTGNLIMQGLAYALRSTSLLDEQSPDDVLPLIGNERRMPRYPLETTAQYRARLHGAWEANSFAGADAILMQLEAAGVAGEFRYYARPGPNGEPFYWSQFWVFFPYGSHPITGPAVEVDSGWTVGDGTVIGATGGSAAFFATLRGIIRKWKPVQWIGRGFVFGLGGGEVGAFNVGDGTVVASTVEVSF